MQPSSNGVPGARADTLEVFHVTPWRLLGMKETGKPRSFEDLVMVGEITLRKRCVSREVEGLGPYLVRGLFSGTSCDGVEPLSSALGTTRYCEGTSSRV